MDTAGLAITDPALDVATKGTGGYPNLIQLIGYWIWQLALASADNDIDSDMALAGVHAARRRLGSLVHEPALRDPSHVDRTFLAATAVDDGPSRMADIAARLHADTNDASQYRLRLIAADIIRPTNHGYVDSTIPYLREYLREHVAAAGSDHRPRRG